MNANTRKVVLVVLSLAGPAVAILVIAVLNAAFWLVVIQRNDAATAGRDYYRQGEWDKAITSFTEAISQRPTDVGAYVLGALSSCEEAISQTPKSGLAYNNFAWLLATSPVDAVRDGKKALETAKKACDLTKWKNASCLGTLAAAFAEVGDFDQAVKYEKQVLSTPEVTGTSRAQAQQRLDLYQHEKPYHGTPP